MFIVRGVVWEGEGFKEFCFTMEITFPSPFMVVMCKLGGLSDTETCVVNVASDICRVYFSGVKTIGFRMYSSVYFPCVASFLLFIVPEDMLRSSDINIFRICNEKGTGKNRYYTTTTKRNKQTQFKAN